MSYKYKHPTNRGYEKFRLSKVDHNKILGNEHVGLLSKIEAYYNNHEILIHYSANLLGKVATILFIPINILVFGFSSTKDIIKDSIKTLFPKRYGYYFDKTISPRRKEFVKIEKIYKSKSGLL